jgi:hypothetical protein
MLKLSEAAALQAFSHWFAQVVASVTDNQYFPQCLLLLPIF